MNHLDDDQKMNLIKKTHNFYSDLGLQSLSFLLFLSLKGRYCNSLLTDKLCLLNINILYDDFSMLMLHADVACSL